MKYYQHNFDTVNIFDKFDVQNLRIPNLIGFC
jgi:hypothetical protein